MNLTMWMMLVCSALALSAITWWGCAWWYGRRLSDAHVKLEKVRSAAGISANQARRQIAQLQKELAERPPLSKAQRSARDEAAEAAARKIRLDQQLDQADRTGPAARLPAHGFADTLPMA
jgi:hypothetical protein